MPHAVTFPHAATLLGYKSAGILYRLKRQGLLDSYIIPGGPGPALLVLAPAGLPSLADHVAACRGQRPASLPPAVHVWGSVRLAQRARLLEAVRQAEILLLLPPEDAAILRDLLLESVGDVASLAAEWA